MEDDGHAHGLETTSLELGSTRRRRRGQTVTQHVGEVHPALLDDGAVFEYARATASSSRSFPYVFAKATVVSPFLRFDVGADPILQFIS